MNEDEKVLVVKSSIIFSRGKWQGLKKDNLDYYIKLIKDNYEFKKRKEVERNPAYQQIIPYIIFSFQRKYFIYKYLSGAGEQRLVDTYQLGIGGHINLIDSKPAEDILERALMREWEEEIFFKGNILEKKLVGIINDDSRMVDRVHLGLIYEFRGDSPEIFIRENEKMEGELNDLQSIKQKIKKSPGSKWANIILNEYLINKN